MRKPNSAWSNVRIGVVMAAAGALLAACGGSDDPPPPTQMSLCDADYQTVLYGIPPAGTQQPTESKMTVHYKRTNGDYAGWQLHAWGIGKDPGWNVGYNSVRTDTFGAVYEVPLSAATGNLGYVFHKGDAKDHGGADQTYAVSSNYEIWRKEGDAVTYTTNPDAAATPDITKVRVHYKRYDNAYDQWGLHMWEAAAIDVTRLPGGAMPDWNSPHAITAMPGYAAGEGEVVFEIPVRNPKDMSGTPVKGFPFIIHGLPSNPNGGTGNKDGWSEDIKIDYAAMTIVNQVGDVWIEQQNPAVFYSKPDLRSASVSDARAYWVNKQIVRWPRVDTGGTFKLYASKTAAIKVALDGTVSGADTSLTLDVSTDAIDSTLEQRFSYFAPGVTLKVKSADEAKLPELLTHELVLVQEVGGKVQNATLLQPAGILDDLYAGAKNATLGANIASGATSFALWAPTAQKVTLCVYDSGTSKSTSQVEMTLDKTTGIWKNTQNSDMSGKYYKYAVDVFVKGVGIVRNLVTDPYSVSLSANSERSYIADLNSAALKPAGWDDPRPAIPAPSDQSIYQMHVRDFSIADTAVAAASRGKYLAFADAASKGMAHLKLLKSAGLTNIQLLPTYDFGSVDEVNCKAPAITMPTDPASKDPATVTEANKEKDCFNWGYDPVHFGAVEGSYSTNPNDGAARIKEYRAMVKALHDAGLHVTVDKVYNHTYQSGQGKFSVLDRIVPGYYHRLDAQGAVSRGYGVSLDNTASENAMFEKLMIDTAIRFAVDYKIDAFRFDWMSDHSIGTMKRLRTAVIAAIKAKEGNAVNADNFYIYGEGWTSGATERFRADADVDGRKEANQLNVAGTGLGAFNDRIRDGLRGVSYDASGDGMLKQQGWVNGRWYDVNEANAGETAASQLTELIRRLDMLRSGMTGAVKDFTYPVGEGGSARLDTGFNLAGGYHAYTLDPQETVNYVAVHDNRTLFDYNTLTLPQTTSMADRIRVQALALGTLALSQGTAFFAGADDILRSKVFDNDSFNAGDWYNQIFWDYSSNNFAIGLPNKEKNESSWETVTPLLKNAALKPTTADITASRDLFIDKLKLRYSSPLFRLKNGAEVKARLSFYNLNTDAGFDPTFVAQRIADDCTGCTNLDPNARSVFVVYNVDKNAKTYTNAAFAGKTYTLSPVQANSTIDTVVKDAANGAKFDGATGTFTVPARSIAVFVEAE